MHPSLPSSFGCILRGRRAAPSIASCFARLVPIVTLLPLTGLLHAPASFAQQAPAVTPAITPAVTPETALDPVVVTANRIAQPLSSVLADVSVIDRAAIERSGAVGVADLLTRLPGIEISRNGGPGAATSVFIRGGEARHTAVYIDGVRVDSQTVGGAAWEQIPLEQIERIEVVRGPAAAVYGSDAVAGVVQLFTRRGAGALRPSASLSVGSLGTAQGQVGLSGSSGALDYALSAAHGLSSGFNARTIASANPDDDGWRRSSAHARIGYRVDRVHRLDASLLASYLRSQFDGQRVGVDEVNRNSLRTGSIGWRADWSDTANTRLQLGQTESTYEARPDFYRTETTLRNLTLQHEQIVGRHGLTGTLERREDQLVNPATAFAARVEGTRHQDAIGLGWRSDFGAHGVQLHLRHDEDSEFGGKQTGSLGWGWAFQPNWRVTAGVANSFRVPTLYQRFSQYGNPGLEPETGRNLEVGLRWAQASSEASVTVWRNRLTNLIGFGASGPCADAFGCYVNVGRAQLQGLTLAGRTRWAGVDLRASLSWHDPRDLDTDLVLARRAKRMAKLGAQTDRFGWTFGAELALAGERYDDARNTRRLGGYGLLNLLFVKPLSRGLTLEACIDNVADKDYQIADTFATTGRYAQLTLRWALQ